MFDEFYRDKNVLVTGHTGFKGSWLISWLLNMSANITGFSLDPPSDPFLFNIINFKNDIRHCQGDIRDYSQLLRVVEESKPDIVFHLAAQPLVLSSYKNPVDTYSTNVMGTVNLLDIIRKTESVRAVLNVTSDKCYENKEWVWGYRENERMGGHDPYSSSKGCSELVTTAFIKSFFPQEDYGKTHQVALASARAGNVIGGGDWGRDRLVPDCIQALSKGSGVTVRAPKAIRPWQHVLEPLSGYLTLAEKLWNQGAVYSGAWNFGPDGTEVWDVEAVVTEIVKLWGNGYYSISDGVHLHEASWLKLDCSKARIKLGWTPRYSVSQALEETVCWYKDYYSGVDDNGLRMKINDQISAYCNS